MLKKSFKFFFFIFIFSFNSSFAYVFSLREQTLKNSSEIYFEAAFKEKIESTELSLDLIRDYEKFEEVFVSFSNKINLLDIPEDLKHSLKIFNPTVKIMGGHNYSFALKKNGEVFSFGSGGYGRLGHGVEQCQIYPRQIESIDHEKIIDMSIRYSHSLLLNDNGDVISFGNGKFGQLGHGDKKIQFIPKVIKAMIGKRVIQVSAGQFHSLLLTDNGEVYSFGLGDHGQLGHHKTKNQSIPKKIEAVADKKIIAISAGENYSLLLTQEGKVFSFGTGIYGELGHGEIKMQILPKQIEALAGIKITQVSAGSDHTLLLDDEGKVYSFGYGRLGQLGYTRVEHQCLPKQIETFYDKKIIKISAGQSHSLLLAEDGRVLSFGYGQNSQLGHGDFKSYVTPKLIEAIIKKKIIKISAGTSHSFLLTDEGEVLAFGNGAYGQLGNRDQINKKIPTLINELNSLFIFWEKIIRSNVCTSEIK